VKPIAASSACCTCVASDEIWLKTDQMSHGASKGKPIATGSRGSASSSANLSDFGRDRDANGALDDDDVAAAAVMTENAPLLSPKKEQGPKISRKRGSTASHGGAGAAGGARPTHTVVLDIPTAGKGDKVVEHALAEFDKMVTSLPQAFTSDQMAFLRLHVNKRLDQLLDDHTVPIPQSQIIDAPITIGKSLRMCVILV